MHSKKFVIILFNLGGPDSIRSVKKFLFNLFYDPLVISLTNPLRWIIAKIISTRREKTAQEIYSKIGGYSPILKETISQKYALNAKLKKAGLKDFKIFVVMRHFYPQAKDVMDEIKEYDPDEIILLPLYPQFSTTTTLSSINDFLDNAKKSFTKLPKIKEICCYPNDKNFIKAHISLILESINKIKNKNNFRILFSAHGLPLNIIKSGDPYSFLVEETVRNIVENLDYQNLDYKITYQSKVGPLKWLEPYTEKEIEIACIEGKALLIVPIAFVSEHVETLVELDIEYKKIADNYNIEYIRAPSLGINDYFIESLKDIVFEAIEGNKRERICPSFFKRCFCR